MKDKTVTFFTYANKEYEHFVLPFIFSILKNTDARAEIALETDSEFFSKNGKKVANLINMVNSVTNRHENVHIYTQAHFKKIIPNTVRFLKKPYGTSISDYVYIIDVDMIIDADKYKVALENNIEGMKRNKTCFFNFVRKNQEKLSGVHFVDSKEYYPKLTKFLELFKETHKNDFVKDINAMGDEGFLYNFIKGTFGDPEKLTKNNERILPGDHLSPNRGKTYPHIRVELEKDSQWKYAFTQFDQKFIELMK